MNLQRVQTLKLLKPLSELSDNGNYWHYTMTTHVKKELGIVPITGHGACFVKKVRGNLNGLLESYVDETRATGCKEFDEENKLTEPVFDSKMRTA